MRKLVFDVTASHVELSRSAMINILSSCLHVRIHNCLLIAFVVVAVAIVMRQENTVAAVVVSGHKKCEFYVIGF